MPQPGRTLLLASVLFSVAATAQVTQFVPDANVKLKPGTHGIPPDWDFTLTLNANFAIAQNSNVVGQPEGAAYVLGLGLNSSAFYLNGPHELRAQLTLLESFSKTPALERILKATDLAKLELSYAYFFLNWMGAFARASVETPLLVTQDIRGAPTDYTIARLDGTSDVRTGLLSLKQANGGQPLTMTQGVGLVAKPVDSQPATVTIRVGGGARETLARGVFVNKDDKTTPAVELVETDNVYQGGLELAAGLVGAKPELRLTYGIDAGVLIPFLNNDAENRGAFELTRLGLAGNMNFSLFEWLGLKYQLMLISDPQLISGLQVQNNLFLTFNYDVIPAKKAPPVKDALQAAQEAATLAEEKAKMAEERARAAEENLRKAQEQQAPPPPTEPTAPTP